MMAPVIIQTVIARHCCPLSLHLLLSS